jgi:hypothetical protein
MRKNMYLAQLFATGDSALRFVALVISPRNG